MLQKITTGLAIFALVVVAIFSIQNLSAIDVSFLTWSVNVPKIVVILGSYLLGMLTGGSLFHLVKRYFRRPKDERKGGAAAAEPEVPAS